MFFLQKIALLGLHTYSSAVLDLYIIKLGDKIYYYDYY